MTRQPDHTPMRGSRIPEEDMQAARQASPALAPLTDSALLRALVKAAPLVAAVAAGAFASAAAEARQTTERKGQGAGRPRQTPRPRPRTGNH